MKLHIPGVRIKHTLPDVAPVPSLTLPLPEKLYMPLSMHIGAPAAPCVSVGEQVYKGQKIGEARGAISAAVHAPVSGTVLAIEQWPSARGGECETVIIENDGLETLSPDLCPHPECENDADALVALVRECGIVGMGGATFPTAAKIDSARGKVDTVILNGAECEPGLASDYAAMLERSDALLHGIRLLLMACGAKSAILAIEENKGEAISLLSGKLPADGSVKLQTLPSLYPQGGEKQLIYNTTGREIRSGGLPADVGCAVFNVETAIAVAEAVESGMPLIERYCTLSGSAFAQPKVVRVRIGTPVRHISEAAGGYETAPKKIILGGPMMGMSVYRTDMGVNKGSNGILAMAESGSESERQTSCIRCGRCVENCPMGLMPNYLNLFTRKNAAEKLQEYHVFDCLECGVCAYGCPARLPLVQQMKLGKARLRAWQNAEKARKEAQK